MEIRHEQQGLRHAFFIERDGKRVAEQTLSAAPDGRLVIIDHTEVDDSLRGQGVARLLTLSAAEWARSGGVKLVPLCPVARAIFDKEPSLSDVLA